jgi:uncharacterized protein
MYELGFLYENGEYVLQNWRVAREWYEKASAARSSKAKNRLGLMLREGKGGERDIEKGNRLIQETTKSNLFRF